jgi:hypothetical protein
MTSVDLTGGTALVRKKADGPPLCEQFLPFTQGSPE